MSRLNHSLYEEFPEHSERIHQLKLEDAEFARFAAEYHKIDHQVRGLEMCNIPVSDATFEQLKFKRLHLKDELYRMLKLH